MNYFMQAAIEQAKLALKLDEFPIGAVIVHNNQIIASAHNLVEQNKNPTHHAEMLAINIALKKLGSKYLTKCDMYITLEPCLMCFKAISLVKMQRLYICRPNSSDQYSVERLCAKSMDVNHLPEIISGIDSKYMESIFTSHIKKLRK